jgi:AraC-like DNA-binding protein
VRFEAGDILMMPHGDPYAMLSRPDQRPEYDAPATIAFFREMAAGRMPLVVEEGGGGTPRTVYVCGYLGCDARPFNPLLAALPRLVHIRRTGAAQTGLLGHLVACAMAEVRTGRLGSECIRLGLTELLFVEVMRRHLEALPATGGGWLAGLCDPAVGRVLAMLHGRLAHPWTLRALADGAALSRAALAERFTRLVGCPPIAYLTRWRMQVAARLLADPGAKVSAVAAQVGYKSDAAFSRAFKKATGMSPAAWRRRTHPAGDTPQS